ncbi:MAG: hypothetical protein AB1403_10980 [Candidatus Riflebacteria bacterium]
MKIRPASFLCFLILMAISVFVSQKIEYRSYLRAFSGVEPGRVALIAASGNASAKALIICSHGTNSHKEVFLPIATIMALQGAESIIIDSSILSTDEGISKRVEEIHNVKSALTEGRRSSSNVIALGHSDGGPPSLAFLSATASNSGAVLILGSQLSERIPPGIPTRGFVGGFDQIFPAADVINDFRKNVGSSDSVRVSWLSDHFTEQYDPILLSALSDAICGKNSISPFKVGLGLLAFAVAIVLALAAGMVTGAPDGERRCYAWGIALFVWITLGSGGKEILQNMPVPAVLLLFYQIGLNCGFVPGWNHLKPCLIFFVLMEINVVLGTAFFWENIGEALPWLPAFLLWYPVAWVCKLGLFGFSLMHRAFPAWMVDWNLPWLILTILPLIISRGIVPLCLGFLAPTALPGAAATALNFDKPDRHKQLRFAVVLMAVMVIFWVIRFSQGMIQAEILQAVAGNFMRTLLLPCSYLIFLVLRRRNTPCKKC